MRIWFELEMKIVFYHKETMKELLIDNSIKKVYNENSSEYEMLCNEYKSKINFDKENNERKWNEELTSLMIEDIKESERATIKEIENVALDCWTRKKQGYVSMCGITLNLNNFCAFKVLVFNLKTGGEEERK